MTPVDALKQRATDEAAAGWHINACATLRLAVRILEEEIAALQTTTVEVATALTTRNVGS